MNNLLEKIKRLDKRILIGAGIAVAVVIIVIVTLVIGAGNNKGTDKNNNAQNNTQSGTETEGDVTEILGTEELETEMTTETELDTEVEDPTVEDGQTNTANPDDEDLVGTGGSSDPIMEIVDTNNTVKTVNIAPGKTACYGIYRVGGMYLTIENPNAYVIYEGKRYDASNGKVSLKVKNEIASVPIYFEIGNKGSEATAFTLKFSNAVGVYANPEKISKMGTYTKNLAKGNDIGYYYKYIAEKTGVIRFYIDSATNECEMSVTNNSTSINRTFESDVLTDANGKTYIELSVTKGDVLMIQICAKPDKRWNYPATDVKWSGIYQ